MKKIIVIILALTVFASCSCRSEEYKRAFESRETEKVHLTEFIDIHGDTVIITGSGYTKFYKVKY